MSDKERFDLAKLSQRDLMIRLLDRSETLSSNIVKLETNISKIEEVVIDVRINVAVLKAKSVIFGAIGGVIISILVNVIMK